MIVPNLVGMTVADAEKILKETDLVIDIETEEIDKNATVIKEQLPTSGIKVYKETKISVKIWETIYKN